MGFRTVVVLSNDQAHEWSKDPELGKKITQAAAYHDLNDHFKSLARQALPYGEIVQCVHADTQSVVVCDGYGGKVIAGTLWYTGQTEESKQMELLKAHAEALGYRVVKKSTKVAPLGAVRTMLQD